MNEKIKSLALVAGFDYDVHNSADGNFYGYEARWINQEIVTLVRLTAMRCIELVAASEHQRAYPNNYIAGEEGVILLEHKVKKIKDYFEV